MTSKITSSETSRQFAKRAKITQREASRFVDAFQSVFEEALLKDKVVKINGLGTFKLIAVEARRSIDVTSGKETIIAEHYKLNFTADAGLKEKVNQPLSHLQPIVIGDYNPEVDFLSPDDIGETGGGREDEACEIDPLKKLESEAISLQSIISQIQQIGRPPTEEAMPGGSDDIHEESAAIPLDASMCGNEESSSGRSDERAVLSETGLFPPSADNGGGAPAEEADPDGMCNFEAERPQVQTIEKEPAAGRAEPMPTHAESLSAAGKPNIDTILEYAELRRRRRRNILTVVSLSVVITLIAGCAVLLFVVRPHIRLSEEENMERQPAEAAAESGIEACGAMAYPISADSAENALSDTSVTLVGDTVETALSESIESTEGIIEGTEEGVVSSQSAGRPHQRYAYIDVPQPDASLNFPKQLTAPRRYAEYIDTIQIKEGSRLTNIALKYYGSKDYWVYIFEANSDVIGNPDNIHVGIIVKIPQVPQYLTDKSNPETLRYARFLRDEYVKINR